MITKKSALKELVELVEKKLKDIEEQYSSLEAFNAIKRNLKAINCCVDTIGSKFSIEQLKLIYILIYHEENLGNLELLVKLLIV